MREVGVGVRCGDGRKQEIPKRCHENLEFQRFEPVLSQERLPLHLLSRVSCEIVIQAKGDARRQLCLAAIEGRADRASQAVTVEIGVARQYPEIEKIFHSAVVAIPSAAIASSFSATTV